MTTPHCPENGGSPVDRVQREPERDGVEPNGPERVAAGTGSGRGDGPERDGAAAMGRESAGAGLRVQRRRLLDWVRGQLVGPAGSGPLLGSPAQRYPTGVLHPVHPDGWGVTGLDPAWREMAVAAPAADPPPPSNAPVLPDVMAAAPDDEDRGYEYQLSGSIDGGGHGVARRTARGR